MEPARSGALLVIVLVTLTSLATAVIRVGRQSKTSKEIIPIISFENIQNQDGSYKFSYLTGHGISVSEEGRPKNLTVTGAGNKSETGVGMSAQGAYSYPSPGGGEVSVVWTADENGFRPKVSFKPQGSKKAEDSPPR